MKKLFIAAFVSAAVISFAVVLFAAEDRYALADFESIGIAIRGGHPEMIGGGNFVLGEDGSLKPFTRKECEAAAKKRGGKNGLYMDKESSGLGRLACFAFPVAKKYLIDNEFWNIDLERFLQDNPEKFPGHLKPSEAKNYSIFPLE